MTPKQLSKAMSEVARKGHKKHPRGSEVYRNMVNKRWDKHRLKLSTGDTGQ